MLKIFYLTQSKDRDIKPEIMPGVQAGNGISHDICRKYAALPMHAQTENRKYIIFMQRRLYIDKAHRVLDIFRFAVLFIQVPELVGS